MDIIILPLLKTNVVTHQGVSQSLLVIPICIRGSKSIPVCIWGSRRSPYAYGDRMTCNPHMHTGIKINPPFAYRDHMALIPVYIQGSRRSPFAYGDHMALIPVYIRGFAQSLYAYRNFSVTNRMHRGNISIREIKSCIPICVISHTGIAVCILGSPYANGQGSLKKLHMGIPLRIMKLCAYED